MNQTDKTRLLEQVQVLFNRAGGITELSENDLITGLGLTPDAFQAAFQNKEEFLVQATRYDLERQKREHQQLLAPLGSPVERILALLKHGIAEMQRAPKTDYVALQQECPRVWEVLLLHLSTYSTPQIHGLLNEGVLQRQFRGDINIGLVTKIILEQMQLILNTAVFPPSRYNLAEVFRSIYLYYIRGICTDEGIRLAAAHFARI
ncbi:TetR/AcrR family transcriptional regulator [Hymenobacter taeanensis]|uniref:TetR/AcrR family transcriptional regulator n=1 Tax=Hymenobacter taeanensis TaxID=2735321 RepID=A0A6M6BFX3_9BACT|nr:MULTISPECIES: TetR/AcrR family transcriptional regulator [Hymenobacter]QJX46738.1 TetR/AcrR family transcriptional regulator [Hymenobacter taeanensis]UOQ80607.1 TetR/AcrR family transcriptional regulator [Hymenobacter sp. 5414T-23]